MGLRNGRESKVVRSSFKEMMVVLLKVVMVRRKESGQI
jgi:hypothetical protein